MRLTVQLSALEVVKKTLDLLGIHSWLDNMPYLLFNILNYLRLLCSS